MIVFALMPSSRPCCQHISNVLPDMPPFRVDWKHQLRHFYHFRQMTTVVGTSRE